MTRGELAANEYVKHSRDGWANLVWTVVDSDGNIDATCKALASSTGRDWRGIQQQFRAIQWALANSLSIDEIIFRGSKWIVAEHKKSKPKREAYVRMSYMVTPELEFSIHKLIAEHCRILQIKDTQTYWEWWYAEAVTWTPQQLRHSAGMPKLKERKEEGRCQK